jgi:predicted nucleotidyltransferase component of viral defense system
VQLQFAATAAAPPELKALYFKVRQTHIDQGAERGEADRAINALRMARDQEYINLQNLHAAWEQAINKTKAWRDWLAA